MKTAVCYHRISNDKSGGLDSYSIGAQQEITARFCQQETLHIEGTFCEVESGTLTAEDRPELAKAIALAIKTKSCLVFSRIDRLARNAEFLLRLQSTGVEIRFCDMPSVQDRFTIGILALVAEQEARNVSIRTRIALQRAKAAGVILGNPRIAEARQKANAVRGERAKERNGKLRAIVDEIKSKTGLSKLAELAEVLNLRGIKTARGNAWTPSHVFNLLQSA
ncbi:MAG: recombinase family protein [Verrucomicrobia bacterium]|nr:recombinase family protein [Verrucomicrobiota bacterium]